MRKGQIFSLDFLLGVLLIIVIIGSLTQAMDVTAFTAKQNRADYELFAVGDIATEILISSPKSACKVVHSSIPRDGTWDELIVKGYEALPNCVDMLKLDTVLEKDDLFLSDEYQCLISVEGFADVGLGEQPLSVTGCNSNMPSIPDMSANTVYRGRREVIRIPRSGTGYGVMSKDKIVKCIQDQTNCSEFYSSSPRKYINLYVWRTP